VIDILRQQGLDWRETHVPTSAQAKLLRDLLLCRTAALGGHLQICPNCDYQTPVYNSCRNRFCPNCQALSQARWTETREQAVLPIGHHHVVFAPPSELRSLALMHPVEAYNLFMEAARQTLCALARDMLGGQLGITIVLHTWTRELLLHPHVHCIVSAGALCTDGQRFIHRQRYLFPAPQMRALFRGRILAGLDRLQREGVISPREHNELVRSLPAKKKWVVHIERPFGKSTHVLKYLGRYTHRIAISDARLISADDHQVCFATRGGEQATLTNKAFMERFMLHVLPKGFHKIRHYGLYAPGQAVRLREMARALCAVGTSSGAPSPCKESWDELLWRLTGKDPLLCPRCGKARMLRVAITAELHVTGPP
jgi:hypothetical protein